VAVGVVGTRYVHGRSPTTVAPVQSHRIGLLLLAPIYILVLLSVFWAPYNFTLADKDLIHQRMSHFFGVPLARALEGDDLSALNGFLQKFLLFAPVGAWIAIVVKPLDRKWRVASTVGLLCLTASFALMIELGKILLPSRSAAFDHVVICTIGSLIGLIAMNHLLSFSR
jgi:glycopeptide antibiotics resistance protein